VDLQRGRIGVRGALGWGPEIISYIYLGQGFVSIVECRRLPRIVVLNPGMGNPFLRVLFKGLGVAKKISVHFTEREG